MKNSMEPASLVRGQPVAMVKKSMKNSPNTRAAENRRPLKGRMHEVYAKAAMLFRKKGYLNASVNEIAQELGIQKGSLYYYINDKETLLFDILNRTMDTMLERVGHLPSEETGPAKKLDHAIHAHIVNASQYLNEFSVLLHDTKHLQPELRDKILSKRNQYEEIFLRIIREGISKKVFLKEDPKMLAYMILGSCNWLYQWFSPDGAKSPRQIANLFSKIFLNGLLKEK